jgi:polysaccharide export outer membrane protein
VANVSSALTQAGGITRVADVRHVELIRRQPDGTSQTTTINLWDALVNGNEFTNHVLRDGDTLYVPKLADGESINASLMARSSVAPATVRVRVIGEVKAPGQVAVPPNSTVSSAVAIAGGPTDKAQLREVTLVRLKADGQVDKQTLNLDNLVDTIQVEEGDVVLVPKAGGDKFLDFAGRLLSPLSILVPWFRW